MSSSSTQDAHLSVGNATQLIGKVMPDLSIKVLSSMDIKQSVPVGKLFFSPPKSDP